MVDLSNPDAKCQIIEACEEYGLFKVVNHGIPLEVMTTLEAQALRFFNLQQSEKDRAGPPDPFGYGCKQMSPNGDVGLVEITSSSTPILKSSPTNHSPISKTAQKFSVKKMTCEVLELMADGLGIEDRNALSNLLRNEKSDSCFRLNYYPSFPELQALSRWNLIGFGEYTDPQIISVLRSYNTASLQISLKDGTWVSIPPDHTSFFLSVGDCLQVMTNGRSRSVKHRVLADTLSSRISMIYFGGPPLSEKITPLPSVITEGEESLYKEFTWSEYKQSVYKTRLANEFNDRVSFPKCFQSFVSKNLG